MLNLIRSSFDVNTEFGWFLPLAIPIFLWWLLLQSALQETGLKGDIRSKTEAVTAVNKYVKAVNGFPGQPVISVHDKRNGNKEARLVVRTMSDEDVIDDLITPFIFPALAEVLFSVWCCSMIIRFKTPASDPWRNRIVTILMFTNLLAIFSVVGINGIKELWDILK